MAILIRQELFKLFRRKKTLVVIIAFILLTTFMAYGTKQSADFMKEYSTPEFQIENLQSHISYLESELNNIPDYMLGNEEEIEEYKENLANEIQMNQEEIKRLKNQINSDLSWEESLAENIKSQEVYIEENKNTIDSDNLAHTKIELEELKYLQDHNIQSQ